jgi:hypothetical protein
MTRTLRTILSWLLLPPWLLSCGMLDEKEAKQAGVKK